MNKKTHTIRTLLYVFYFSFVLASLLFFGKAHAAIITNGNTKEAPNCFDFYHFQSVGFDLVTDRTAYQPGDTVTLTGTIKNSNTYPVFDGVLFARIARDNGQATTLGPDIIDETILAKDLVLPASGNLPVTLSWKVPAKLGPGSYVITFFFSVGSQFNLSGLPFTNEVVGGTQHFTIDGPRDAGLIWDRARTTVNGTPYKHIGNWPEFAHGDTATISQTLKNDSRTPATVTVTQELFSWDSQPTDRSSLDIQEPSTDRLLSTSETITLAPGATRTITYTTPSLSLPVYYLRTSAIGNGYTSIINTRLLTTGLSLPRLNYVGLTTFPLQKAATATLFACFHNTSQETTSGTVRLSLLDARDRVVAATATTTTFGGNIQVLPISFVPSRAFGTLTLSAEVLDTAGKVIDSYRTAYDCNRLPSGHVPCPDESSDSFTFLVIGLGALVVALGVISFITRKPSYFYASRT